MSELIYLQSTQLACLSECPRKWWYNFQLGRCKPPSDAMLRGSCFHKLAEFYYGEDMEVADCIVRLQDEWPDYAKLLPTSAPAFVSYVERWKDEMDVIKIDGKPAVEQEFTLQLDDQIFIKGKIDYLREQQNKKYASDWKVTGMYLSDWYFMPFEMSFQTKLYSYVANEFFTDLEGFIIDATMVNKAGKIDHKRQFFPMLSDGDEFIAEVYRNACFIRDHKEDESAFEHRWTSCVNRYGRCSYFEICRSSSQYRHELLQMDDFKDYEPLYDEQKGTE